MKRTIHATLAHAGRGPLSLQTNPPNAWAFDDQVRQTFANVETILGVDGFGLEHIVKVTAYRTDPANVLAFNQAYEQLMPAPLLARVD